MPSLVLESTASSMHGLISEEDYKQNGHAWGLHTFIDVFDCDREILSNEKDIRKYVVELCDLIEVKRYGDPQLVLFGGDPPDPELFGWSIAQMIETSNVTGHFIQAPRHAYVDIFSCKYYDAAKAIYFTTKYFQGSSFMYGSTVRGNRNAIPVKSEIVSNVIASNIRKYPS